MPCCCAYRRLDFHGVLLCHRIGHRADLHSFPTRRSSDLGGEGPDPVRQRVVDEGGPEKDEETVRATLVYDPLARSEEHTSELQSRGHLVCRLLLEKKKNAASNCN